jgi:hypothetical protein
MQRHAAYCCIFTQKLPMSESSQRHPTHWAQAEKAFSRAHVAESMESTERLMAAQKPLYAQNPHVLAISRSLRIRLPKSRSTIAQNHLFVGRRVGEIRPCRFKHLGSMRT